MSSRALPALGKPIAMITLVLIVFALFNDPFRQIEADAAAAMLHASGVAQSAVQGRPNASLAVFPRDSAPFLVVVTPACSALSSLLALAFLALFVPARYRRRILPASACVLAVVAAGNVARIAGSVAVGMKAGVGSLVLFHDWVGSLFAFCYTLGGYLFMLFILLPARARPDAAAVGEPSTQRGRGPVSVDLWWFIGGTAAVLVAVVWRHVQRMRVRAQLALALRDANPVRRRAAVEVAADQGLRRHAALLGARVSTESDPGVRAALLAAVLRGSWEPADHRDVLHLRLWAQEEAARQPGAAPSAPVDSWSVDDLAPQVPQPSLGRHQRRGPATESPTVTFRVHAPPDPSGSHSRHAAERSDIEPATAPVPVTAAPTTAIAGVRPESTIDGPTLRVFAVRGHG